MQISSLIKKTWKHQFVLLVAGLLAVLWAAVAWNHNHAEAIQIEDSRRETAFLALLFAKHAESRFSGIDVALLELRKAWVSRPFEMQGDVRQINDSIGESVLQTAVINAEGFLAFSSLGMPEKPVDLRDREHFKVHQASGQDALFVSRPVKGRVSGKWSIQMTRPIFNKGTFAGVIVMSLDPRYFSNFYEEGTLKKGIRASMVRDTGDLMATTSNFEKAIGKVIKPGSYAEPGAPLRGNSRSVSQVDGTEQLYSYVRLPAYGLSAVVARSVVETLAPARGEQRTVLLQAGVVTVITLLMALQLLRELNRKETAQEELLESQRSLQASHSLLQDLSENVPGIIYQYRWFPDGRSSYPFVSKGIQTLYNLTAAQVIEKPGLVLARMHPDDRAAMRASIDESARTLQSWKLEFRVMQEQGVRWVAARAEPKKLDDGSILWHGFAADITDRKKSEAALQLANQELETFSYSVSHDLRSPLSTVAGFSALLAKKLTGSDNEQARHYLSRIQTAVTQMERLIVDLLTLAQVARSALKYELVDLSTLAGHVANNLQAREPERPVVMHIETGLQAQGDPGLLRAVLENLLANAWKYSSKQASAEIHVGKYVDAAESTVFFVKDNGVGFDMAYSDKLFEAFERLHAPTEFTGNGVGLATVSRIIGRHGGRVWAESAPGLGATFFFTLG